MLTIARLTVREAARRRLLLALAGLTLVVIALSAWGFQKLTTITNRGEPLSPTEIRLIASQLLILVMFTFSFVLALSAVFVAAPAIAAEVESGIALAILSRPISRSAVVLGKWIGFFALIVGYTVAAGGLELWVVERATGYVPPHPTELLAYLIGETLIMLTLALCLSTRLPAMTGGVLGAGLFGGTWMCGVVGGIGTAFGNAAIANLGTLSRLALPTDGLWRGAIYSLEPAAFIASMTAAGPRISSNPFFVPTPPPASYVLWAAFWLVAVLGLAVLSFRKREL